MPRCNCGSQRMIFTYQFSLHDVGPWAQMEAFSWKQASLLMESSQRP